MRLILAVVVSSLVIGSAVSAQPVPPQMSCEEERNQQLYILGGLYQQVAQSRALVLERDKQIDALKKQIAETAKAKPKPPTKEKE